MLPCIPAFTRCFELGVSLLPDAIKIHDLLLARYADACHFYCQRATIMLLWSPTRQNQVIVGVGAKMHVILVVGVNMMDVIIVGRFG